MLAHRMADWLASTFFNRRFAKFLVVGGVAALSQWASRFIFSHFTSFGLAVFCAYLVGVTTGYLLNAIFVFPDSTRRRHLEVLYYVTVNLAALPLVWGISILLGSWLLPRFMDRHLSEAIGNGVGILSPVATSFLLHKRLTFRGAGKWAGEMGVDESRG